MSHSEGAANSDDFDKVSDAIPVVKAWNEFRKFFKTRSAILAREPLYNCSKTRITNRGLMGPLAFNATQSTLSAIPAVLFVAVAGIYYLDKPHIVGTTDPLQVRINEALTPLKASFTLPIIVFATAYACLPTGHITVTNWKAAQRKYLYLDGAHGVWSQLTLASCYAVNSVVSHMTERARGLGSPVPGNWDIFSLLTSFAVLLAWFWQLSISYGPVMESLFEFDYLTIKFPPGQPPALRYYIITFLTIPVALRIFWQVFNLLALSMTGILHSLQHWFGLPS